PCWPLLVPLLIEHGPYAERIRAAVDGFDDDLPRGVAAALVRADRRLARLDRLVARSPELAPVRVAAAAQIEGALADLGRLRLRLALATLDGELPAQVRSVEEV